MWLILSTCLFSVFGWIIHLLISTPLDCVFSMLTLEWGKWILTISGLYVREKFPPEIYFYLSYCLLLKITIFFWILQFIDCIDMLSAKPFRYYFPSGLEVFCHKHDPGFSSSLILNQGKIVLQYLSRGKICGVPLALLSMHLGSVHFFPLGLRLCSCRKMIYRSRKHEWNAISRRLSCDGRF